MKKESNKEWNWPRAFAKIITYTVNAVFWLSFWVLIAQCECRCIY